MFTVIIKRSKTCQTDIFRYCNYISKNKKYISSHKSSFRAKGNEEVELDRPVGVDGPVGVGNRVEVSNLVGVGNLVWVACAERASYKEHQDLDLGYNKQEEDSFEPMRGKWYEFLFLRAMIAVVL